MKKTLICLIVFSLLCALPAGAQRLYDQYWKPGEYRLEMTEEQRAAYRALGERAQALAAGSPVCEANESATLEWQYEQYLQLSEAPEKIYEDVGPYTWAVGLPDEEALPREEAYLLSCMALSEQYGMTDDDLILYWPKFSYVTADPENPVWELTFLRHDGEWDRVYTVSLYAHDGSVCGVRCAEALG